MTFCIGIRVREGIIALADTRIVVGSEKSNKQKLAPIEHDLGQLFAMTSGLRSIRDKALIYMQEEFDKRGQSIDRVYEVANLFGEMLRKVRDEDGEQLHVTGLTFNSHAIIGGCLAQDRSPQMFYVYPQGNWIESNPDLPYFMIGRTYYGKPILDRLLNYETPLRSALSLALLAYDATRTSVTDVAGPIDVAILPASSQIMTFGRFTDAELEESIGWWNHEMSELMREMPMRWMERLFENIGEEPPTILQTENPLPARDDHDSN